MQPNKQRVRSTTEDIDEGCGLWNAMISKAKPIKQTNKIEFNPVMTANDMSEDDAECQSLHCFRILGYHRVGFCKVLLQCCIFRQFEIIFSRP